MRVRLFGIGCTTGLFGAVAGVGGGVIAVPLLANVVGLPYKVAVGTAISATLGTALSAGGKYYCVSSESGEKVPLEGTLALAVTSIPMGYVGTQIAHRMPTQLFKRCFGGFILVSSSYMLASALGLFKLGSKLDKPREASLPMLAGLGCIGGLTSGMFGIAGGILIIPSLALTTSLSQPEM
eukprot:gene12278-3612_t